jgi:hypothetical protein
MSASKKTDVLDAEDALNANLKTAMGIVHLAAVASLREHDVDVKHFYCALDTALDHLQEVQRAAADLCEARKMQAGGTP